MRLTTFESRRTKQLEKRKGGGGGGRGGGSSSGSRGGGSGSGSTPSPPKGGSSGSSGGGSRPPSSAPVSGFPPGSRGASTFGNGGGKPVTIPSGSLFAGRSSGGGTRGQVFGTRSYGSGYPNQGPKSVAGRSFPFGYWPIIWGAGAVGGAAYLHNNEYGDASNSSRPGGALVQAPLQEPNTNTTYHLVSDNSSMIAILNTVQTSCSLANNTQPKSFNPNDRSEPQPEQAIQYYRSSSVVLTLDGYNNSAANNDDPNAVDTPLPSGLNMTFLDCLNSTIGAAVPIEDADTSANAAISLRGTESVPIWGTVWLLFVLFKAFI